MDEITKSEYIDILMEEVGLVRYGYVNYTELFKELFSIYYVPDVDSLDVARCTDVYGILRSPYGWGEDDMNVSILEILIAMCIRIGHSVMGDEDAGKYFWEFIGNLGLLHFTNKRIGDGMEVRQIVINWLERRFKRDGTGSPWPIKGAQNDLRELDLWRHCNLYLSEKYV